MKYILLVCVWQREVDYSLYILEDQCVQNTGIVMDVNKVSHQMLCSSSYAMHKPSTAQQQS